LDYARLDERSVGIRPQRVDLSMMLKEIRAALEDEAKAQDITVVVDSQCPPLWADPQHTRAILLNLLRNAIKFSPGGASVWLQSRLANERVALIEVRDQGFGIEPGDQERIFQPFVQLDTVNGSSNRSRQWSGAGRLPASGRADARAHRRDQHPRSRQRLHPAPAAGRKRRRHAHTGHPHNLSPP
jgi:signal transduction histidine kinase